MSGPDCADSFTGSCQHNEPSEASNEAITVCGMNNQSSVNSVGRILQRSRVDNKLRCLPLRQSNSILYWRCSPRTMGTSLPLPITHTQQKGPVQRLPPPSSQLSTVLSRNHEGNSFLFWKIVVNKDILTPTKSLEVIHFSTPLVPFDS